MRYTNGQWEPFDILADLPDDVEVDDYIRQQGWYEWNTIGSQFQFHLKSYQRTGEDGGAEFMLEVAGSDYFHYLLVDALPTLLDLMARWAPIAQAGRIDWFFDELACRDVDVSGAVENIAKRVMFGQRMH